MSKANQPSLLILNQMAGPLTWELAEDLGRALGPVALLTGHPDTLAKGGQENVRLCPAVAYRRGSYVRRVISWLRYMVQAFCWLWRWPKQTPLLLFSNPPLLPWLGCLMHLLRGQRYSVMVHDIYPDVLVRMNGVSESHPVIRIWRWLNRHAYERADVVMTLGEHMAATLARQFNPRRTKAGRIEVIYPWADTEMIRPLRKEDNSFAQKYEQVDKLTLMYSGNMGLSHDLETMLTVARRLESMPEIHFMFIGAGPKWNLVEETVRTHQLKNVTLLPWQPEETLPSMLTTADVGMISLDDVALGLSVPSKAFYMMTAGAALLGISEQPSDLQAVIDEHQCGLNVRPGKVDAFAQAVLRYRHDRNFLNQCRQAARLAAETSYSRRVNIQKMMAAMFC